MKKETRSIEFTYERPLRMRWPTFALSKNIQYLDSVKLSKGSHTIELGKFEDCGCDCAVLATVKNGMVTGIKYPRCKRARSIPLKAAKAMAAAYKKLRKTSARGKWQDIPVHEVINGTAVARLKTTTIDDGDCVMVCWEIPPPSHGEQCMICCGLDKLLPHKLWCIFQDPPSFSSLVEG